MALPNSRPEADFWQLNRSRTLSRYESQMNSHEVYTAAIQVAGKYYLSTGYGSKPQAGHNDVSARKGSSSRIFIILNGPKVGKRYVFKSSNHF